MQFKEIHACEVNIIPSSGEGKVAREVGDMPTITNNRGERKGTLFTPKPRPFLLNWTLLMLLMLNLTGTYQVLNVFLIREEMLLAWHTCE